MTDTLNAFSLKFVADGIGKQLFFRFICSQELDFYQFMIAQCPVNFSFDIFRNTFLRDAYNRLQFVADSSEVFLSGVA